MLLKLKMSTPNVMVYGETGRFCLEYYAKKRVINFWSRISCGDHNKLTYLTYSLCKHRYDNGLPTSEWFSSIVNLLNNFGIHSLPESVDDVKATVKQIHTALHLEYVNRWEEQVLNSPKCSSLYKHVNQYLRGNIT